MANDLNQCQFIGRLGKDPEMRYMTEGKAICSFSLAVGWKSKDKEATEWVNVVVFEKLAEICGQYLKKGSQVYISGRMKTEKYEDKEGITRYSTKIAADRMQMLGGRDEASAPRPAQAAAPKPAAQQSAGFDDMDNDIPW
jgi:single-strand DNA-binding protein